MMKWNVATTVSSFWNTNFPLLPDRTTAANGDHDATAETPTATKATNAPGADENYGDLDDEHEYVNTETDNSIESENSDKLDIDKQCSKQLLNATNVGTKSIPNTKRVIQLSPH